MRIQIRLQNDCRGDFVEMPTTLFARDAHLDACLTRILGAVGFIPEFDGQVGLLAQGFGKTRGAATFKVGLAVLVEGLPDDDQFCIPFSSNSSDLRSVNLALDMLDDGQRAGDGGGLVAEGESDIFLSGVYG